MFDIFSNFFSELYFSTAIDWHQVRGAQMILSMKIISLGFDIDSFRPKSGEFKIWTWTTFRQKSTTPTLITFICSHHCSLTLTSANSIYVPKMQSLGHNRKYHHAQGKVYFDREALGGWVDYVFFLLYSTLTLVAFIGGQKCSWWPPWGRKWRSFKKWSKEWAYTILLSEKKRW